MLNNISIKFIFSIVFCLGVSNIQVTAQENEAQQQYENSTLEERTFDDELWESITDEHNYTERPTEEPKEIDFSQNRKSNFSLPSIPKGVQYIILFAGILLLVGIILYVVSKSKRISNTKIHKRGSITNIDDIDTAEDIRELGLDAMLTEAIAAKRYKDAVRIYYLLIIRELTDKNQILWKKDKTNHIYLLETASASYNADFKRATLAFEKVWFGDRVVLETDYVMLESVFSSLLSYLKKGQF